MGKPNPVLNVWIAPEWRDHPAVVALRAQGHAVREMSFTGIGVGTPDLILHPAAHGWSEVMFVEEERKNGTTHRPYVDAALTMARARRRKAK